MLKLAKLSAFAVVGALMAAPAFSEDKPAATVNGVAIPQARVDMRVKEAAAQGRQSSPELREAVLQDTITLEVLSQAAVKQGLDKQPDVAEQIAVARESALARAFVQDYMRNHPIGEDALKAEYDTQKTKLGASEYKVSHILVKTEDEAKAIAAQLKKGAKFDKIAKEKSEDPGSKGKGGELGWSVPTNFVPPFADALTKLGKGQVSAPVQTQFGWHIIKLEDVRNLQIPPFEEVKPGLMQNLQQKQVEKLIAETRKGAKVE